MSKDATVRQATLAAAHIRRTVLQQSMRAGVGHIGSALSVADLIASVHAVSANRQPDDVNRDRFVLSKGHAALALYAALHFDGLLGDDDLDSYCGEGTLLGVHPEHALVGIDFSTGSLGQGLTMAVGAALAARLLGSDRRVYCLISDAECNEGSIWEAAMFAGHHKLDSLVVLVDYNQQQALGYTHEVSSIEDMAARWRAFGWTAHDVDGHDHRVLIDRLSTAARGGPVVLVAHTTFGSGVSFMEREVKWHYLPMTADQYRDALSQIAEPV